MNTLLIRKYDFDYKTSPYKLVWVRSNRKNVLIGTFRSAIKAESYVAHKPIGLIYILYDCNDMPVFRRDKRGDIYYDL